MMEDGMVVVRGEAEGSFTSGNSNDCETNSSLVNASGCVSVLGSVTSSSRDETLAWVEVAVLGVLLVVILVSNLLVLVALIRSSLLKPMSRTYLFMAHICIADLMVGLCNVLSQLAWDLTYYFQGPNWLCKSVKFVQVMPLYLSPLLLACLAIDRYRAISWRIGNKLWPSLRMVSIVWTLSAVLALPQTFIFSKKRMSNGEFDCWADFPEEWAIKAYVVYFVCAAFFGPMLVIVYCYTCITLKVWRYSRYRRGYVPLRTVLLRWLYCLEGTEVATSRSCMGPGSSVTSRSSSTVRVSRVPLVVHSLPNVPQPLSLAKMKTIKLTLIITFFFIVCHAPFCVTQLYRAFATAPPGQPSHPVAVVTLLLPSLPSCVNPWIYLCFSENLLNQICGCTRRHFRTHQVKENNSIGDQEPEDHHHHRCHSHSNRCRRLEQRNRLRFSPSYNRRGFYAYRYPTTLSDFLPKSRPKEQIELAMYGTSL